MASAPNLGGGDRAGSGLTYSAPDLPDPSPEGGIFGLTDGHVGGFPTRSSAEVLGMLIIGGSCDVPNCSGTFSRRMRAVARLTSRRRNRWVIRMCGRHQQKASRNSEPI